METLILGVESPAESLPCETFIQERRTWGRLEKSRLRCLADSTWPLTWARRSSEVQDFLNSKQPGHVHSIAHGVGFWPSFRWARRNETPYSFTIHDDVRHLFQGHIWRNSIEKWVQEVWNGATNRFVISPEIGEEYNRRYGQRDWTMVTDGLDQAPVALRPVVSKRLNLYFAGGLNVPYEPNFLAAQQALKLFQGEHPDWEVRFIVRGGRRLECEDPSAPPMEARPFAPQSEVVKDLEEVDLLYLPLSIDPRYANFAKFSLSTKMITYLGSGLPVFYHGPRESAAYQLLKKHDACVSCFSNDPQDIYKAFQAAYSQRERVTNNALSLGRKSFMIDGIRDRFWSRIN
ncbi:MAG: hypothetical protein AAF662_10895 [Pseudomonadota bacterium]